MALKIYCYRTSDEDVMDALGRIIVDRDLNIGSLAQEMGIGRITCDAFMKGKRKLQMNTKMRICEYINKMLRK